MSKLSEWLSTDERKREFAEEQLIVSVAEQIWAAMEISQMSKAKLAEVLGSSKSHVTQLLSGSRNMTLRSLAEIGYSLGCKVHMSLQRESAVGEWAPLKDAILVQLQTQYLVPAPAEDFSMLTRTNVQGAIAIGEAA